MTNGPAATPGPIHVFVSYAREDRSWLDRDKEFQIVPFLEDSLRRDNVVFWRDHELLIGEEFKLKIEEEINKSQIALLIVSQDFLNSEFIQKHEMQLIAKRTNAGEMIAIPLLVAPCRWPKYPFLANRQMVPNAALVDYIESPAKWARARDQILDGFERQVEEIRNRGNKPPQIVDFGPVDNTIKRPPPPKRRSFAQRLGWLIGRLFKILLWLVIAFAGLTILLRLIGHH